MIPLLRIVTGCIFSLVMLSSPGHTLEWTIPDQYKSAYIGTLPWVPWVPWEDKRVWANLTTDFTYGRTHQFPWPYFWGELHVAQESWIDQKRLATSSLRLVDRQENRGNPVYGDGYTDAHHVEVRYPEYIGYESISRHIQEESLSFYEQGREGGIFTEIIGGRGITYQYREYFSFLPSFRAYTFHFVV